MEGPSSQHRRRGHRQRSFRHPHHHASRPAGWRARPPAPAVVTLDGETSSLSATTASKNPKDKLDFFPLTVDVEERMYAAGRIPGSFFRREGRPSEDAILTCRLIDRPAAPVVRQGPAQRDPGRRHGDGAATPTTSTTSSRSTPPRCRPSSPGLPFSGPIGATRVALIEGQWVAFPTHERARARRLRHGRRRSRLGSAALTTSRS